MLSQGLSIHAAANTLDVAPSRAFRWRHRFLALARDAKAGRLTGIVEADETFCPALQQGPAPHRAPAPSAWGQALDARHRRTTMCPVLVVRDRSGASTDFILGRSDKAQLTAVLAPVLAPDVVLCTDGSSALAAAARHIGLTHQALSMSSGLRTRGPWHIQNVNAHRGRLKEWMRRFHGVATSYLASYLGWFRALDRSESTSTEPACLLALALGHGTRP